MSHERCGMKIFVSFLSGAAIGAGLALLFAPQSGKETRKKIKDFAEKVGDDVKDGYDNLTDKARSFIDGSKESIKRKIHRNDE